VTTFVLIHGAGSDGWYWHRVQPELERRGSSVIAPDLPADDESAGLDTYVEVVLDAVGARRDLVVVGQSLGAFTAPIVAARTGADRLVLVAPMIPAPGETAGDWWTNTGWDAAHRAAAARDGRALTDELDPASEFLHDVDPEVVTASTSHVRAQAVRPFADPWPLDAWPDVPTQVVAGRDDRFFPIEFERKIARERLGLDAVELPGGHLPALARPEALAAILAAS
jgi:pimeloyl-ACP methyl ester carboxylesterase